MAKAIRINKIISDCEVLGPGNRLVISLQGCHIGCKDCIVPHTLDPLKGRLYKPEELFEIVIAKENIEGITLTGGEPFEQAESLIPFVYLLKKQTSLNLFTYTGYQLESIVKKGDPDELELLIASDMICDGPFKKELFRPELLWRGSTNQRFFVFSKKLREQIKNSTYINQVELFLSPESLTLMGVPSKTLLGDFENLL